MKLDSIPQMEISVVKDGGKWMDGEQSERFDGCMESTKA